MQKIPLVLAKAGMVLAKDIYSADSNISMLICEKGTELSDSLIARFNDLNIQAIQIEEHDLSEDEKSSLENILFGLEFRFSKTTHNPLNAMLHDIHKAYQTKSMGGDSDRPEK